MAIIPVDDQAENEANRATDFFLQMEGISEKWCIDRDAYVNGICDLSGKGCDSMLLYGIKNLLSLLYLVIQKQDVCQYLKVAVFT